MVVSDDIYREDVDFTSLALQHAGFAQRLKSNGQLDFSDPESVRQLTKALLQRDFDLMIDLPEDRLCPPVPNRFNYIVFIQKLVDNTRPDYGDCTPSDEKILGLDIGTGSSAIYPLLACRQRENWFFMATELDPKSREWATRNVKANKLQSRIKVVPPDDEMVDGRTRILPVSQLEQFDDYAIQIQMTNPPFYASETEMLTSAQQKSRPPNSSCTGAPIEMITPGGETSFINQLIAESKHPTTRTKIQWFSSMLGKLSSLTHVVDSLRQQGCTNYVLTEFVQGSKTKRWCVAWSWTALRPRMDIARGIKSGALRKHFPFPSETTLEGDHIPSLDAEFDNNNNSREAILDAMTNRVNSEISKLDIQWQWRKGSENGKTRQKGHQTQSRRGVGRCKHGDVWSRKARRQKLASAPNDIVMSDGDARDDALETKRDVGDGDEEEDEEEEEEEREKEYDDTLPLAFQITISTSSVHPTVPIIHVRWLQGHDSVLFESFCGWLRRKVGRGRSNQSAVRQRTESSMREE